MDLTGDFVLKSQFNVNFHLMLRIAFIVVADFQVTVFGALTVFEMANRMSQSGPHYAIQLISEEGDPIGSPLGYSVITDRINDSPLDTLIIGGCLDPYLASAALIEFLKDAVKTTRRVGSMCMGAFFLADRSRATTGDVMTRSRSDISLFDALIRSYREIGLLPASPTRF